jgi:GH43 family beta-xylosidase
MAETAMPRKMNRPRNLILERLEPRTLFTNNGLFGQYFDDANLTTLRMTRQDSVVNFDFANASPAQPQMSADTFSVRWTGQIQPEFSETYTFHLTADDGVRLWVRGQLLIDRWSPANRFAGDANEDGSVNLVDFNILASHFGTNGATWNDGDFSGDGLVNLLDFNLLASHFGQDAPPPAPVTDTGTITLTGGQRVDFKLEYFDRTGPASINLKWSSPTQPIELVPRGRLFMTQAPVTFTNPIIGEGADPWVTRWNNQYVYVRSDGGAVWVSKSNTLQGIGQGAQVKVWDPPPGLPYSENVWAPELHYLDGKWYIYVAADDGDNRNHRMYVLEGNTQDPAGSYTFKGKIAPTTDRWAIDGTVLETGGSRYFVWSGWSGFVDGQQNLYIAQMSSPWTISGDRAIISSPTLAWEQHGLRINEGPTALLKDGKVHIIYSASGFWTPEYSLGQLTFTGTNIMSATSWTKKPTPVFSATSDVVGVGHASFTKSPDGFEDWIVYHAHNDPDTWTGIRDVRAQPFTWFADHSPNFGQPIASGTPIDEPTGTPTFYFGVQTTAGSNPFAADARIGDEDEDVPIAA